MPWIAKNATEHTKKATSKKKKRQWAAVANSMLRSGKSEGAAIRAANAAVGDRFWEGDTFLDDQFRTFVHHSDRRSKMQGRDPKGRETGTWEEEDDDDDCNRQDSIMSTERRLVDINPRLATLSADKTVSLRMYDRIDLKDAKVRQLENGYVAAMPRIARTGIQIYAGDECGRKDMERVRVFRPDVEVFHKDAVHSYTHLPVTLNHPDVPVTADNWKKFAVGETGDEVLRDGGSIRVPMMLRDAEAIKAFKEGTNQLSVGYDCDLIWVDGVTDDGEKYDAIQHGIRANHLAVVAAARGGSTLKIGDVDDDIVPSKGEFTMNMRTILIDGIEVQVADQAATLIQRTITSLQDKLHEMRDKFKKKEEEDEERDEEDQKKDAALKKLDDAVKAKDKELETKNGEIAALKSQVADAEKKSSPAAIDAAARERAGVIGKAQTIMGGKYKTDGMTVSDIRRGVVEARLNCKDWSDDRITGAFDAMQQANPFAQDRRIPDTTMEDTVRVFGRPGAGYQSPAELRDKSYNDYDQSISEAWRGTKAS